MKDILQGIADNAAKGIFAVIHFYGTVTTQDLLDCGYSESMVYLKVKKLVKEGLILRAGRGVYRDANSNGLRSNSNRLEEGETIGHVLQQFSLKFPDGTLQTGAEFLSLKDCDNVERYVKGKVKTP